jgi:multidrug transporter EmrE-like cation transporter
LDGSLIRIVDVSVSFCSHRHFVPGGSASVSCTFLILLFPQSLFYSVRIFFVLLQFLFNSLMLHSFVRSMHQSNSVLASAFNQAFMAILSGLSGYMLFGEETSLSWKWGMGCMLAGIVAINLGNRQGTADDAQMEKTALAAHIASGEDELEQTAETASESASALNLANLSRRKR